MLKKMLSFIGAYKVYEKWLWQQVKSGVKPEHIAIILDGNRRWANEKESKPFLLKDKWGHAEGADTVEQLLDWCSNRCRRTCFSRSRHVRKHSLQSCWLNKSDGK